MVAKKRFEHNSVQDVKSITDYLKALIEGFEKGEMEFIHGDEEIKVFPQGLLLFALEASAKGDRRKIKLKIRWRESEERDETPGAPLIIRAGS